jgi:glutamate dehydrogenase
MSSARSRLNESLLRAWRASVAREDWRSFDQSALTRACAGQLDFGLQRRRRQTLLRVTSSPDDTDASYSTIELVTEDMPFLVDTLSLTLSQLGVPSQLIVHPVLRVDRDSAGRVRALDQEIDAGGETQKGSPESWQYWRIDRLTDPADAERLRRRLLAALIDVRYACGDWMRMRDAVRRLCADIARNPPPLPADVIAESRSLLQYMENHHFTFLGYRESRLIRGANGPELSTVPGTDLGLLRRPSAAGQGIPVSNIRHALRTRDLLIITKANRRSSVHRDGYLDYIGVKRFDARGRAVGEARILGLWTSSAYQADPYYVPLLRLKIRQVTERFRFAVNSHDAKRLAHILETLPRDELLQAGVDDLSRLARAVLVLQNRSRVRLILRRDEFRRFWSCLVYLPRERCDASAQARIQAVLSDAFHATETDTALTIGDSPLAQLHVVVRVDPASQRRVDPAKLEQQIAATLVSWRDRLRSALQARFGESQALALERRYEAAFPDSYLEDVDAALAVDDIADLEVLDSALERMQLRLYHPAGERIQRMHLRLIRRGEALSVSEVLPTFEHFGLRVIAERPYRLSWADGSAAWIQDFELEHHELRRVDVALVAPELIAAFRAVRAGELDDDGFNRLLVAAGLKVRQVTVLRACCRYLLQTGIPFSQAYMERVLGEHATTAGDLVQLFEQRLAPRGGRGAHARAAQIERRIRRAIEAVVSPDQDRILRAFLAVVLSTLRTNYYRRDSHGIPRPWLALKLDPARIPGLPSPRPAFEIFVHSPRVEGVHLRKGAIARGGIRWSERPEDFRTEVLGLMKAQHVKNTLIIPVGAKGGFVARRLPPRAARDLQQREVIECYRSFIRGLLDVTDNIVNGRVSPPPDVRRLDGDDPYLVVAADKGTASFSDIANAIAAEYGFWLGDAFASGGSSGYDHKKMGITARGAWECIKRHFREIGSDIQRQPFTVAGIGDMSGDVFGNGMLLSRQTRLVAAFNHQHVFLDPDPDAARTFRERERLFRLPRSGWNDYNQRLLSRGGMVFERSVKSVSLSAEARALLDLQQQQVTPVEVIRAILSMRVDLLWNGGIGTYVKASDERNGEIGDRGNDAVRVDGRQLRALVVGEGGNLGLSQRGRIEYASRGGRLNPDFIDNSAGVNTSDVEVNLKILLDAPGERPIPRPRRDRLLVAATDEVAALVLRNNYLQSQALSLLSRRAPEQLNDHRRLMRWLERHGELDRAVEFLPTEEEIEGRRREGRGLTRPELALLFSYGKIAFKRALTDTDSATDPYLARELERYFPTALRRPYAARIKRHRLRHQIINTATTNSIVNRVGPLLLMACDEGANAAAVARAYTIARDSADLRGIWSDIESLDGTVKADDQYDALLDSSRYLTQYTAWLLAHRREYPQIGQSVAKLQPALREFAQILPSVLEGLDRERYLAHCRRYAEQGLPVALAERLGSLEPLRVAPDLIELSLRTHARARLVAQAHFGLSARLGLDWLHGAIEQLPASGDWQRAAQTRLQNAALGAHLKITAAVLGSKRGSRRAGTRPARRRPVSATAPPHDAGLERWNQMLRDVRSLTTPDFAALTVAVEALSNLAAGHRSAFATVL